MSLLDTLIYGYRTILSGGVEVTRRNKLNVIGATITDNATTGMTDMTISGGGGGATAAVPMRSSAIPTALVVGVDYHLTMTVAGVVTLPAAPANGTSFEIKGRNVAVTITAGAGDTIETGATYVTVAWESVIVRYDAAATDWELC